MLVQRFKISLLLWETHFSEYRNIFLTSFLSWTWWLLKCRYFKGTRLSEMDALQAVSFGEAGSPPHGPCAQLTWIHKLSPSPLCKYGSLTECALLYLWPEDVWHAPVYRGTRWPVTWRGEQTCAMHLVIILCGWGLRRCKAACLSILHQNGNCIVPLCCLSAVTRKLHRQLKAWESRQAHKKTLLAPSCLPCFT